MFCCVCVYIVYLCCVRVYKVTSYSVVQWHRVMSHVIGISSFIFIYMTYSPFFSYIYNAWVRGRLGISDQVDLARSGLVGSHRQLNYILYNVLICHCADDCSRVCLFWRISTLFWWTHHECSLSIHSWIRKSGLPCPTAIL
jgi:hypothetical protein